MKEDSVYNENATKLVKDVFPKEYLNHLVNLFMQDASVIMGNDFTKEALDFSIDIVIGQYSFLPVCYIASAFKKGAMGKYGSGRLVPRTIGYWLEQEAIEYNRYLDHKTQKEKEYRPNNSFDLNKYPVGSAIIKKLEWFKSGKFSMDDWDKVPLKDLAERISMGLESVPETFGLKSLKPHKS